MDFCEHENVFHTLSDYTVPPNVHSHSVFIMGKKKGHSLGSPLLHYTETAVIQCVDVRQRVATSHNKGTCALPISDNYQDKIMKRHTETQQF